MRPSAGPTTFLPATLDRPGPNRSQFVNKGGSVSGSAGPGLRFQKDFPATAYNPSGPGVARPNQGGTITKGGVTREYAPSPAGDARAPGAMTPGPQPYNSGGSIEGSAGPGLRFRTDFAPTPYAGAVAPMAGAPKPPIGAIGQPAPVTSAASKMGFSSRGASIPAGDDIIPTPKAKAGKRTFADPKSRNPYDDYAASLLSGGDDL